MKFKLLFLLLITSGFCKAQTAALNYKHNLDKQISLDIKKQPIAEVLNKVSKAGDFYFSYSGKLFTQDSIVSINVKNAPVRDVLDKLFTGQVDYKEIGEHVILRYAANHLTIEPENITNADQLYLISGYVVDTETGLKVKQASVYEKRLLQSVLTDDDGYFKLRFKGDHPEVILTVSKENYRDTSLIFLSDVKVKPEGYKDPNRENAGDFLNSVENLGFSKFFISSKQRIQSLNIPDFFVNTPFQASLTPGLSSHGIMSSQVVNKVSLNILGGYTGGVDGVEVGGLFNITKGNVKNVQVAGLFNGIGGSVEGVQVAGLMNEVRTRVKGIQVAGLVNEVSRGVKGMQIAGLINISSGRTDGTQISGLGNIASKHFKGMQIAGLFNYAAEMSGMQVGLINVSDKNTGYSIGLVNYVHNGYHKISFYTNETINSNVAIKMGNANLYNIILAGKNFSDSANVVGAGLGFGHDFIFSNRISVAAELSTQYLYLGNWDNANFLNRFQTNLQVQIVKGIAVFGGPVYAVYRSEAINSASSNGYKQNIVPAKHHDFSNIVKGWVGWNAGITFF